MCLVIQSSLTLCDSMDCSPPGSSVLGDSPSKNTGVGCHALLQRIFPNQGSTRPPTLQVDSLPSELPGKQKNTGVGSLSLLQGNLPIQESNQGLLCCRWILYQLSYQGSPLINTNNPAWCLTTILLSAIEWITGGSLKVELTFLFAKRCHVQLGWTKFPQNTSDWAETSPRMLRLSPHGGTAWPLSPGLKPGTWFTSGSLLFLLSHPFKRHWSFESSLWRSLTTVKTQSRLT